MSDKSPIHPQFQSKEVFFLDCKICENTVCRRAMESVLVADSDTRLFSTDCPEKSCVALTGERFETDTCNCQLENVACTQCGNVVGYNVRLPCKTCLQSCNNGHLWMFYTDKISPYERFEKKGDEILLWGNIPKASHDHSLDFLIDECLR
ncbi:protein FAM72B-like [Saccostrea echinata]|uniref:protein FAM72B-like n=1 Tax=Saccostrea echinata TaxID=191078 RepID=UPI002A8003D1|nr:protein FAM72B-like [Saccostrea echinata]